MRHRNDHACYADGCDRHASVRGYCDKHYERLRVHGHHETVKRTHTERVTKEDFIEQAAKATETACIEWPYRKDRCGYGFMKFGGRRRQIHRVVYEKCHGTQIPAELVCRHKCDNPGCVNPLHLEVGTQKDNIHDCINRGRFPWGRTVARRKLSDLDVGDIARLFVAGMTNKVIAAFYEVSAETVRQLRNGLQYKSRVFSVQAGHAT